MKHYLKYFLSAALLLSSYTAVVASDDIDTSDLERRHEQSQRRKAIKKEARTPDLDPAVFDYNKYVAVKKMVYGAANSHNLIKLLRQEQLVMADYKAILDDYEDLLARYKSNRTCNINLLSPYYVNPEAAWDNLAEAAFASDKLVSASVSNDVAESKSSDAALARWNIGYKFLSSMYANQSEYGAVKKAFPLWADQKYQYDNQYKSYYANLAGELRKLGGNEKDVALLASGPSISDDVKYDTSKYSALVSAHKSLLNKVLAGKSSDVFNTVPPAAPKALPPWKEIIYANEWTSGDYSGTVSFYPVTPESWVRYTSSSFKIFNKEGEMSKLIKVVSQDDDFATIRYNTEVLPLDKNRVERYLILREAEEERRVVAAQVKLVYDAKTEDLQKKLKAVGIVSEGIDFSNIDDVNSVIELIKEKKVTNTDLAQKALESVESLYKNGDRGKMAERLEKGIENLKVMITALKTDKDGMTNINNLTAADVKKDLEKEVANQALIDKYKEISDANKAELMSNQSSWCPIY